MHWKIDFRNIAFKMWLYFFLFAVIILTVLWLLQIVFINNYYQGMKTRQILAVANSIKSKYGQSNFASSIQQYTYKNNVLVLVADTSGNIQFAMDSLGRPGAGMGLGLTIPENFQLLREELLQSGKSELYHTITNTPFKGRMLEYGAILTGTQGSKAILFISSPLDPIDSTIAVLKNQLIYISVIILLLAFFMALFIARRFSRPLEKLTATARELAKGNYEIMFVRGNYREIDQLASTLNYATRELAKTDDLRKDLIANVSHDLRTPLTLIRAYAEMIRDISGESPSKRTTHANVIIDEADRLSSLVNDMLDLSKIQSGTVEMSFKSFDIAQTLRNILDRYAVLVEREGFRLQCSSADSAFVTADEKRIEQVIYNLINNAVNYTGADKQVWVKLSDGENNVRFEVTDTGEGIPKEQMENIWERYYQAKESHRRPVVGTGLGLSIVKNILMSHKAIYGVNSANGKGSTFWFELSK